MVFKSLLTICSFLAAASAAAEVSSPSMRRELQQLPICNAARASYDTAKYQFPYMRDAIQMVEDQGVAPWYTDNNSRENIDKLLNSLSQCGPNTRIPMVVYGLPDKDCEAGYSNRGFNKNPDDYKQFINKLVNAFQGKKPIYILEPDALGLTANGGCGNQKNYRGNLQYALEALTSNPDAEIFLDVGFWVVQGNLPEVARFINEISKGKNGAERVKGITLNTSNYQRTGDMIALCDRFAHAAGKDLKCVIDTSRNYRGPAPNGEWCNTRNTGIGRPPTADTGNRRVAYFLWVKPPGESDGECNSQSSEAMRGPPAGVFFQEGFKSLWNNGYFVSERGARRID